MMEVHGAMAAVRVNPEEHLASTAAADMVQALAQMKSPATTPQDLTGKIWPAKSYQYHLQWLCFVRLMY